MNPSYVILQIFHSESEAQQPVRGEPQPVRPADDEQSPGVPSQPSPRRPVRRPAWGSGTEQWSPLSLVQVKQGPALIGRELDCW